MLPDGTLVVLEDGTYREIGRGLHKRDAYERKRDSVLQMVVQDYLDVNGPKSVPEERDYMRNASRFAVQVQIWNLGGVDDSAERKKLYFDIRLQLRALVSAVRENNKTG